MTIIQNNRIHLPRTGQTTSYADGDDGYFQAGNPRATRFVDNGNGTISDRHTGLTWVKDPADCGEAFYTGGALVTMTWAAAVANCLALEYAGYTDWRLPNVGELGSLFAIQAVSPHMDPLFAAMGGSVDYWSSTRIPGPPIAASVRASNGLWGYTTLTTATLYVRPVRGGRING